MVMCKGQESQDAMWMEQWSCVRDKNHKMPCGWNNGHMYGTRITRCHVDGTIVMCKGQESQDAMWMEQWSCVRDKNHKMPCGWNNGHV